MTQTRLSREGYHAVWMAPVLQGVFVCRQKVDFGHVSGLLSRHWPQALMGSVGRRPIKPARSHCPMSRRRSVSMRRSTGPRV
jgi:hypothetical protein